MAASSFTHEQIRHFREAFSQHSDPESGGVTSGRFPDAIQACLEHCSLSATPPPDYLNSEFNRLGTTGALTWQQFFQVLIHINVTYGVGQSSEPLTEVTPQRSTLGRTLRWGTSQFGRAVGNFFGVTESSQHGTADTVGWEQVSEIRAEDGNVGFLTLSRRPSRRAHFADEPPPDYPGLPEAHSFNPHEISDSEEEDDDMFITAAPPDYRDVVQQPPILPVSPSEAPPSRPQSGVTRVSVYQGAEDVGSEAFGAPLIVQQAQPQQQYPAPTYPAEQRRPHPEPVSAPAVPPDDLIYDRDQAWEYYMRFIKAEKRLRQRRQHDDAVEFFGREGTEGVPQMSRSGTVRRDRLQSVDLPEDSNRRRKKKKKKTKLQRQSTLVRSKVESLPSFWPVFIILITVAQIIGMIVILVIKGLAPIRLGPEAFVQNFPSLSGENNGTQDVTYFRSVNLWIGPTPLGMIEIGAKFTPCMRTDFGIRRRNAQLRDQSFLGCCANGQHIGTTDFDNCIISRRNTTSSRNVTLFEPFIPCSSNNSDLGPPGPFHPCCISITGHCQVMHFDECTARGGFFHEESDSCDEVNCLKDVCGFDGYFIGEDNGDPLLPTANQLWRWFLSIFIHLGVIHIAIVMVIQLYVGIKIERTIGWLRVGLIYLISGVGGNIVSAIFIPYEVNAGASAAVFGLLGVLFVELFQFWQIVDHAWFELLKLSVFVVILLALGTLPYVDNWAHVGGLLFGVVSAIIFVPYITFGKWDAFRKRILLIICLPLLILLFIAGFVTFYVIPDPSFCPWCRYINCVPYSSDICPEEYNNVNPEDFSL